MILFRKPRYFVDVCFAGGARPYTYLSADGSLNPGDVVLVPMSRGAKLSRVSAVRPCESSSANLLHVLRRATDEERLSFYNSDALYPKAVFAPNPVPASVAFSSNRGFLLSVITGHKVI